jgi:D-glycero-D-manno-heptose 1,7-bisphosphate phosphatase
MTAGTRSPSVVLDDWFKVLREVPPGKPAAFFDRDGTLIHNIPYLADSSKVRLEAGAIDALAAFRRGGFAIVVTTNQSGIARGLVTPKQYAEVNDRMIELLGQDSIDAIIACPFHPAGNSPWNVADHPWRKPATGMIDAAIQRLGIVRSRSVMVGDSLSDVEAGMRAGLGRLVHVATGHGLRDRAAVESVARANRGSRIDCLVSLESLVIEEMAP